jgi:hypothetical protein
MTKNLGLGTITGELGLGVKVLYLFGTLTDNQLGEHLDIYLMYIQMLTVPNL